MSKLIKKIHIKTHGCQMNEYDSSKIMDILKTIYLVQQVDEIEADILILNTCSIREKAQEKVFSQIGRWKKIKDKNKRNNKKTVIAIGGCVASQEGKELQKRAPSVDIVFGPQTLHRLPNLLSELESDESGKSKIMDVSFPSIEKFDYLPTHQTSKATAFVSIMEGCSKYCTYCVVPYTRGEEISRSFDDVIADFMTSTVMSLTPFISDRRTAEYIS